MLVAVAMRTGRGLDVVARDSYAITLYTAWHLSEWEQRQRLEREHERLDLAGLVAHAFHQPKELNAMHQRFLSRLHVRTAGLSFEPAPTRYARMVDRMRAATFQPMPIAARPAHEG